MTPELEGPKNAGGLYWMERRIFIAPPIKEVHLLHPNPQGKEEHATMMMMVVAKSKLHFYLRQNHHHRLSPLLRLNPWCLGSEVNIISLRAASSGIFITQRIYLHLLGTRSTARVAIRMLEFLFIWFHLSKKIARERCKVNVWQTDILSSNKNSIEEAVTRVNLRFTRAYSRAKSSFPVSGFTTNNWWTADDGMDTVSQSRP